MVNAIVVCGAGFKAPSYHDLRGSLLDEAVANIKLIIDEQRNIWTKKGYNILCDGWTDERGITLLNFLVSSSEGLLFLKSMEALGEIKKAKTLFRLLDEVILHVGPKNVVQVIIDNTTTYISVGRLIKEIYPSSFWNPGAPHCLDLTVEDITNID